MGFQKYAVTFVYGQIGFADKSRFFGFRNKSPGIQTPEEQLAQYDQWHFRKGQFAHIFRKCNVFSILKPIKEMVKFLPGISDSQLNIVAKTTFRIHLFSTKW